MQAVYALHKDPEQSLSSLQKNLQKQLHAAYELYFVLYALLIAMHHKAKERFEIKKQLWSLQVTERHPNRISLLRLWGSTQTRQPNFPLEHEP